MKPPSIAAPVAPEPGLVKLFSAMFGAFLGLGLLKFGNTAIMEKFVERPTNIWEWVLTPWPFDVGYSILVGLVILGLIVAAWRAPRPLWLAGLPLAWLGWQMLAGTRSVDGALSHAVLKHFAATVACFYLGYLALGRSREPWFLFGLVAGFAGVLASGVEQHFGGLEQTRKYFFTYLYHPELQKIPAEYVQKMQSNRIWATLFYPNALAGGLLLLLPVSLALILTRFTRLTTGARQFVAAVVGVAALGCLFWSGSKGGWLLMLLLILVGVLQLDFARRWKLAIIALVAVGGLAGFGLKYAGFFRKGATSVSARFDYWQAALTTTRSNPVFGTGPGTFAIAYQRVKRPESEMARLVHNDYLEQASDSGWVGALTYTGFAIGWLVWTRKRLGAKPDRLLLAVWLGLLGWLLQGLMEFGLYIPALAWPAFALMGWLLARVESSAGQPSA